MKTITLISVTILIALSHPAAADGDPQITEVFVSGENGYHLIRTPQILAARDGTLLVFAQGRQGHHDQSNNDIILKRSTDGGATWSNLQIIAEDGENSLNSVCALQLAGSGRILLVGCIIPAGHNVQDFKYSSPNWQRFMREVGRDDWPGLSTGFGEHSARVYVIHSDDDGQTWSERRDITESAKRDEALTCIPGPGIGIQLTRGPHKGRIMIPCNQHWHKKVNGKMRYQNLPYAVISDDGGENWRYGGLAPYGEGTVSVTETQFVELEDGSVLLNGRGGPRAVAKSKDGGETWTTMNPDFNLTGPECAAGLLRYSFASESGDKSRILFSLPGSPKGRKHGKIWLSYDDGESWPVQQVLRPGFFAYSCLTKLPNGQIGCVWGGRGKRPARGELGPQNVEFASFSLEWLTNGADSR
tara:strand:- start:718 stop:1962 length:1245 start_codon:yes stop_codon:yes gene_type:complete